MSKPSVTVVVATYGRPDALACALESVRRQTEQRWQVLVIGDCCGQAGNVVAGLDDPRIRFANLPARQGEQGPPNSVGMRLADTPLIALLNHDDLWLPDHLARALPAIKRRQLDMYSGSAAFAHYVVDVPGDRSRPVFSERTPPRRTLSDVFASQAFAFEPASALVFTRELAMRIGPWRPAVDLHRTPYHDWLLRVWRAGAAFFTDPRITTLKFNTHNKERDRHKYAREADDQATLLQMLDELGTDGLRAVVRNDLKHAREWGVRRPRNPTNPFPKVPGAEDWTARLQDPDSAARYLRTGHDVFDDIAAERGLPRGDRLREALRHRTGETLGPPAGLDALVNHCRRQLERA